MGSANVVSLLSVLYFILMFLIPVIGNIYVFYSPQLKHGYSTGNHSDIDNQDNWFENSKMWLLLLNVNQNISLIIRALANLLTLIAIPYVRRKYGSQFSLLHLNSMVLILHLSLADLMWSLLGVPNILLVFLRQKGLISGRFSYNVGLFKLYGGYLSYNTVAMISCCVARHNICTTCSGVSLAHDDHDQMFGGRRVYLVCAYIWLVTFLTILPDIIGAPGNHNYIVASSDEMRDFTCSKDGCFKLFPVYGSEIASYMAMVRSVSRTIASLIFVYLLCVLPTLSYNLGQWPPRSKISFYILFNPLSGTIGFMGPIFSSIF